jgi:hypothetical protein
MDFATFSTYGNLFRLFLSNKYNTAGYLSYTDLLTVGDFIPTYKLIQNYTQLFVKNHLIYENLNRGLKINNLISRLDYKNNYPGTVKFQRNFDKIKDNTKKISIEQLFLLFRTFQTFDNHHFLLPFTLRIEDFSDYLSDSNLKTIYQLIDSSFFDYQKVCQAALKNLDKKDYLKTIFNILDINNSTFLEIYEIMLLKKTSSLFSSLSVNGKIINQDNNTLFINNLTGNYSDYNILSLGDNDSDYLKYVSII